MCIRDRYIHVCWIMTSVSVLFVEEIVDMWSVWLVDVHLERTYVIWLKQLTCSLRCWNDTVPNIRTSLCSGKRRKCVHVNDQRRKRNRQVSDELSFIIIRVVKRSSKIRSSVYKFEFEFSFLAFAIRSVIVPQGHAFNKLHNCIVRISSTWLPARHRRPARWNTVT